MLIKYMRKSCFLAFFMLSISCGNDSKETDPSDMAVFDWQRDPANPVLNSDSPLISNICDPTVILDNGIFRMWAGCVGNDVTRASICYSESANGSVWTTPVIVFEPSEDPMAWDNQKTEVPTVIKDPEETDPAKVYKMWYGGSNASAPDLTRIGLAYSPDGVQWTRLSSELSLDSKPGMVLKPGSSIGDAGVTSDPSVLKNGGIFHMWYNSFGATNDILISYATSSNGYTWDKETSNPVLRPDQNWEDGGPGDITEDVSHPAVMFQTNSSDFMMWYGSFDNTNFETYSGIGIATSNDGILWVKDPANPIFTPDTSATGEEIGISTGPAVVFSQGIYHLFYCSADASGARVISHATSQ